MKLEDLQATAAVRGILSDGLVTVVSVQWFGSEALELTYKTPTGTVANELVYRHDELRLEIVEVGRPWSFDGDGALFRLVSEAQRIRLAHLFDPVLAVHTSVVEPLPHQITAVYESMLPRQPLRFLLADDPGAGKTIMAGLLIKELIARGDLQRCLVVCPGSLAEQWQDELYRRFQLPFDILTNDKLEAARTGNWFLETNLVIARLDKLSRNEDVQQKLQVPDCRWDLVVCDEAHKMSATFFGGDVKYTKRYRLGQLLSTLTRHFLLMTATPHNGKEEDFQLFMALLDGDRFEGRFRDGVHVADVSDLMRRMVKENLLTFDGTPLFPERIAHTVPYKLSAAEARLYKAVTDYVREEFNRAEALENDKRAGTVGFALTILQRRLASSPEAIYQSLRRRRERLASRLRELEVLQRGGQVASAVVTAGPELDPDDVEDLDEAPENEVEAAEEEILDQATAARSIAELNAEIETLTSLDALAMGVRRSGADTKWRELASLLGEIFTAGGVAGQIAEPAVPYGAGEIPRPPSSPRQKIVIFTEHRDTLSYLHDRITTLLGRVDAVVLIHGGMGREDRLKAQDAFRHDPNVHVLLATDAAGEGINLQRAHLMVNYDLPWNPNRLEQRFGRIHRIGQTEVCHLWNLVADETREGDVYRKLLDKLEQARQSPVRMYPCRKAGPRARGGRETHRRATRWVTDAVAPVSSLAASAPRAPGRGRAGVPRPIPWPCSSALTPRMCTRPASAGTMSPLAWPCSSPGHCCSARRGSGSPGCASVSGAGPAFQRRHFRLQRVGWHADHPERRPAARVLAVKGDGCHDLRRRLTALGRCGDAIARSLDGRLTSRDRARCGLVRLHGRVPAEPPVRQGLGGARVRTRPTPGGRRRVRGCFPERCGTSNTR